MKYLIYRQLSNDEQKKLNSFSPLIAHLLFHRGVIDSVSADKFLNPDYDRDIHDPTLLKDADKSADRIIQGIKKDEKIAIYADYDADGIPGAAIWHDFFDRIGFKNFIIYIPHRHDEGFGMNVEAVEQLNDAEVKLIITVDCGISDVCPVAKANELGIDVIITDHHESPSKMPKAFAIVDHKQDDCNYPDKNLCGAGIAYKLIQLILSKERFGLKDGLEKWLLDLVGMATLSDMVPLTGENRVFAHYGLTVLKKGHRKGLRRLFEKLRIEQRHINEDDINFMITPRINAASRMGMPRDAFNLLIAKNDEEADKYAEHLDHINSKRKTAVAVLVKEVKKIIHERFLDVSLLKTDENGQDTTSFGDESHLRQLADKSPQEVCPAHSHKGLILSNTKLPNVIVLGNPNWRPSLLGLVANSCVQEFDRPVFLWGRDGDNTIKGSCRSRGNTSVVEIMKAVPEGIISQFGGHKNSGGFAVFDDKIYFLDKYLNEAFELLIKKSKEQENVDILEKYIDAELSIDEVNIDLYNEIAKLAPFGSGNHKPAFLFRKIKPVSIKRFGKGNEHIRMDFSRSNRTKISAISFFGIENEWNNIVRENESIDLVASLEKSWYRNSPELRLKVIDVFINP
ncbi:MAG: single-stranded-DNA-specific exonuclease RecJ [Candidatus Paceibacterota bacterium]|jgi:single-stranded-DNA-specific exonuclease